MDAANASAGRELSGGEAILDRGGLWRACDDRRRHDHDEPDVARARNDNDGAGTQEEDTGMAGDCAVAQHEGRAERHASTHQSPARGREERGAR